MMTSSKKQAEPVALVLLSGGLDSTTTLAYARKEGYLCYALTINYNQRHHIEIERAQKVAQAMNVQEHKVVNVDLSQFGGSALTDTIPVPDARQTDLTDGVPVTYVPARNTVLLSLALAWAEVLKADAIFIGANAVDYSGYPDCRPEFLEAFEHLAKVATQAGTEEEWKLEIKAPLIHLTKAEIIKLGCQLDVDFSLTTSCYNPGLKGVPCGKCESCFLRAKGFAEAGVKDPTRSGDGFGKL